MQKILIVDDNKEIREVVHVLLSNEGYDVIEACNGVEGVEKCQEADLIIMDIMMPKMDGFDACINIREKTNVPILFLTAKTLDDDKEQGFNCGGDDFLVKPFSYKELLGRVKALLRRYQVYQGKEVNQNLQSENLVLDAIQQSVKVHDKDVSLTDIEYRILYVLMQDPKHVYSSQELYETVWKEPYYYNANNTIMVHIRNLRKKLEVEGKKTKYIRTIWGKGYRFE